MASLLPRLLKWLLLGLTLTVLALPVLQTQFDLVQPLSADLDGYAEPAPEPEFSWDSVLVNRYQPALERYAEEHLGFRETLIRLRNQLAYSLFDVAKANQVLVGRDEVLLDETAIRSYLGQDFKGRDSLLLNVRRFRTVQDTLARRGILLVFAIAPDKANFYPEHFPAYFRGLSRRESNYQAYAKEMRRQGVNLLDLAACFQQWKDTASYPLFPRGGIHWSGYGITLAADTLVRYLEQRGHLDLPDFRLDGADVTDEPQNTDNDVARTMNLLREPPAYRMAYPRLNFLPLRPGQEQPRLLVAGDSFNYSLFNFYPYYQKLSGDKFQFWYYSREVHYGTPVSRPNESRVSQLDRKAELLAQRIILVMYTQHNMSTFDSGFSAEAYKLLCPYSPAAEARIKRIEDALQRSPVMQDTLRQRAGRFKLAYPAVLRDEAAKRYELEQL